FITSFPQFFFSFIFIYNLYSYTLFLTNSISLFLGPLVLPVLQLRSFSFFGSTINKGMFFIFYLFFFIVSILYFISN
ncbi:hypothetical protein C1645_752873, partial [Glomus cerebriforme]